MPAVVSILTELPAVHMFFSGRTDIKDMRASISEAYTLSEYRPGMPEICDLRNLTEFDVGFDEMMQFAKDSRDLHAARGKITDLLVIAPTDPSHDLASMFEVLSSTVGNSLTVHIVKGYPEVFALLDLSPELMSALPANCVTERHLL